MQRETKDPAPKAGNWRTFLAEDIGLGKSNEEKKSRYTGVIPFLCTLLLCLMQ